MLQALIAAEVGEVAACGYVASTARLHTQNPGGAGAAFGAPCPDLTLKEGSNVLVGEENS